ncbi:hypothetical protein M407DRAFT_148163 [Tulasnella calospora MUT 4182]|uniref:Uncharacterized protein n=1 Tax=Tulasnella calospora MUT 4182 TaxID=1051891 RepID=A0A0C3PWI7_9AGAM|nr:hypothetical protein M407DRAFT_148163 [Tulasnella calospora MUT 4182]
MDKVTNPVHAGSGKQKEQYGTIRRNQQPCIEHRTRSSSKNSPSTNDHSTTPANAPLANTGLCASLIQNWFYRC